ncbi:MAG TPA: ABC transporter substrate-binding protein [Candidatus Aminicenantes bacterium]|nr:ABC transporter substrate-binding protein [Candidatus Aminicenantes bacterium]
MAPGLTEIVYALDRGGDLVATTRFCDYPAAALRTPKIGGYLDLSLERVLAARPTVILGYGEHRGLLTPLPAGRPRVVLLRHGSLSDLYSAIETIALVLDAREVGHRLSASLQRELAAVTARKRPGRRPRVLLVAGHDPGSLRHLVLVGRGDFLSELLLLAGGENAYGGSIPYPQVAAESVIALRPDWIIDLQADPGPAAPWHELPLVPAVRQGKVRTLTGPLWMRPGPRVVEIARQFAAILAQ